MRRYAFSQFGLDHLHVQEVDLPTPGPGEVRVAMKAWSINYRDLLVVSGGYNPRLKLPATPLSDGAGVVTAVGDGVEDVAVDDRVTSHFVSGWQKGPYRAEYVNTTLGTPSIGVAAEEVVLPAAAVVPHAGQLRFRGGRHVAIAALTAWNVLVVEGHLQPGQTVLTLGTGGVSVFALQMAQGPGRRGHHHQFQPREAGAVPELGAGCLINYRERPDWEKDVLEFTGRLGADVVVENGGIQTLSHSIRATRAGGTIGLLGALTGLFGEVNIAPVLMMRLKIAGILVGSREAFLEMNALSRREEDSTGDRRAVHVRPASRRPEPT